MTWLDEPTMEGFYWAVWATGGAPETVYYGGDLEDIQTHGEADGYPASDFVLFWGPLEAPDVPG